MEKINTNILDSIYKRDLVWTERPRCFFSCCEIEGKEYFIKQFKVDISKSVCDVKQQLEMTEYIANMLLQNDIPAVTAIGEEGQYIYHNNEGIFAVYPWVEGMMVLEPEYALDKCYIVGQTIGRIHILGLKDKKIKAKCESAIAYDLSRWCERKIFLHDEVLDKYVRFVKKHSDCLYELEKSVKRIKNSPRCILSHGDTGKSNFVFNANGVYIIDWEHAGYVYPEDELFDTCLEWSGFPNNVNWDCFRQVVKGYYSVVNFENNVLYDDIVNACIFNILCHIRSNVEQYLKDRDKYHLNRIESYVCQIEELISNKLTYIDNMKVEC